MTLKTIIPSSFVIQTDRNLGAMEITTYIGLVMFGVLLSQGYVYFSRTQDKRSLQYLVAFLIALEACHSFTASQTIYFDTVTRYMTTEANSYPLMVTGLVETLITAMVQFFFVHRIYRLSGSTALGLLCLILVLLRFVGGMTIIGYGFIDVPTTPNGIVVVVKLSWLITCSLTCGAAADVLIAASMLYYLRQMDLPSNRQSTTNIINRLVRFSLQTGLVTSMASVAVIISFQAMESMVWFGFYILLAKIYSNSLLASLNARASMRREIITAPGPGTMSTIQFAKSTPISVSFNVQAPNMHTTEAFHLPSFKSNEGSEEWLA